MQCNPNPQQSIQERIRKACGKWILNCNNIVENVSKSAPNTDKIWNLASKHYYKTLEMMIRGEESQGMSMKQLSEFLNDTAVHRALLCCSFEMMRFIYQVLS